MTIISSFLVLSLGAIAVLVSILVSADVRISAEDHNFTLNKRLASGVDAFFGTVLSNTRTFLNLGSAFGSPDDAAAFFFEKNPYIAAVLAENAAVFINPDFPFPQGAAFSDAAFQEAAEAYLERAFGETFVINGGPRFGVPLLIMFFPRSAQGAAAVFFDGKKPLRDSGSENTGNRSFLINESGDVLAHDESGLAEARDLSGRGLIKIALERGDRNFQTVYTDNGTEYFGAYQRLAGTGTVLVTRIASGAVFSGISAVIRRNILVSAVVLALSILFIILFSGTISRPIKALAAASASIEEGNYRISLNHRSRDEIGLLTRTFIGMGHSLENFEKFTNKTIVRLARQGALTRTGTARTVAVSFIMIRDFGELAGHFDAPELVSFVNSFLSRIVPCITGTGGIVDKFLTQNGVVVMAVWGGTGQDGQPGRHALACVRSALMARAVICNWNAERAARYRRKNITEHTFSPVKMGCGINTGEVIAGQMGSEERMEYTVIGDTVNLASRMEGPNDLFDTDILITENTQDLIGSCLVSEEMGSLEVKGKEKPLRVFSVVNMKDRGEAEKIIAGLDVLRHANPLISRRCAGPLGPETMAEVRKGWLL
ncbi:MAG: HAMP domain-containing protein [Spirochaetaceae bacterium]|nr:HAMP domain-containing protein [Spirochaetaceae bacterium]